MSNDCGRKWNDELGRGPRLIPVRLAPDLDLNPATLDDGFRGLQHVRERADRTAIRGLALHIGELAGLRSDALSIERFGESPTEPTSTYSANIRRTVSASSGMTSSFLLTLL